MNSMARLANQPTFRASLLPDGKNRLGSFGAGCHDVPSGVVGFVRSAASSLGRWLRLAPVASPRIVHRPRELPMSWPSGKAVP